LWSVKRCYCLWRGTVPRPGFHLKSKLQHLRTLYKPILALLSYRVISNHLASYHVTSTSGSESIKWTYRLDSLHSFVPPQVKNWRRSESPTGSCFSRLQTGNSPDQSFLLLSLDQKMRKIL
jgi:hypothetical protein